MNNLPRTTDLVSVVINVLNGSRTISMAIESALNQIDVNLEVIVWDNGSTDGTRAIAEQISDERIRYFSTQDTVPLYEARNRAVSVCRGNFIAFLDADDWWQPNKLIRQLKAFTTESMAVYSNYLVVNEVNRTTKPYVRRRLPSGQIFEQLLRRYRVGLLTLVVRREFFDHRLFDLWRLLVILTL